MIIWLASFPRSGNTLFRILLNQIYGINTPSIYTEPPNAVNQRILDITGHLNSALSVTEMAAAPDYYFLKTHELPHEDYPAIYIVRDALVSYAKFILDFEKEIPADSNPNLYLRTLHEVIIGKYFGGWSKHVLAWTQRRTQTVVITYEDLLKTPVEIVRRVMQEVHYSAPETSQGSLPDFNTLHNQVPTFFRTGRSGTWREAMPPDLQRLFWRKHGKVMEKMGYAR